MARRSELLAFSWEGGSGGPCRARTYDPLIKSSYLACSDVCGYVLFGFILEPVTDYQVIRFPLWIDSVVV